MKVEIDIEDEGYSALVAANLKDSFDSIYSCYKQGIEQRMFSIDPVEDRKEIRELLKSLKVVHNWYCLPKEQINVKV